MTTQQDDYIGCLATLRALPPPRWVYVTPGLVFWGTEDTGVLSRRIVEVFQLPPRVELEMQQIDDELLDREFAMRWWQPVGQAFAETLFSPAQVGQILHYDSVSLASLENCSYLLHRHRREAMPSEDDLESVRQLISELEGIVAASGDIDPDLADFLLKHARAMRIAVDDFNFTGSLAIEEEVDEAVGGAIRRGYFPADADAEDTEGEPESRQAIKKFWAIITRAALILSMSANLLTLGQAANSDLASHPEAHAAIERVVSTRDSPHPGQITVELGPADPGPEIGPVGTDGHS